MPINTYSLKPQEIETIKARSRGGQDEFYTSLDKGYEEHGSLTEAQYKAFKSHITLNSQEVKFLEARGGPDGNDFYKSLKEQYDLEGYLSKARHDIIVRDMKEDRDKPVVSGKRVDNIIRRDGKAVCRGVNGEKCKLLATEAVGRFGYCATCAPTAKEAIPA